MTEKWNIEINNRRDSQPELINDELLSKIKKNARAGEGFGVDDLEKNKMENGVISDLNQAVKTFLKQEKISNLSVDGEIVHILDQDVYSRLVKRKTVDALFAQGHIYHPRIKNKIILLKNLAHEFAHELSFLKKQIKLSADDKKIFVDYYPDKRRGYGVITEKSGTLGKGFNEAMTELISLSILREYSLANQLDEEDNNELFGKISYYPHILILEELFNKINVDNPAEARNLLFRGYFTGEREPLKKLSAQLSREGIKNGLKILYKMDESLESALATAKYLKLEKAIKNIEEFIEENSR